MDGRNGKQLLSSNLTTLSQATFKGWMDIMYAAVDSREVSGAHRNVAGKQARGEGADQKHNHPRPHAMS